jgi:hypothetical protein
MGDLAFPRLRRTSTFYMMVDNFISLFTFSADDSFGHVRRVGSVQERSVPVSLTMRKVLD